MSQDEWDEWSVTALALACELVRTILIFGRPGTGKTHAGLRFGRVGKGVYTVTLTEETTAAEVRGHFVFKGGDAVWHDGPFVRAMREGARLVINEISNAGADVLQLLFLVLESPETAVLTLPSGETVRPAPGFHVVATDNLPPERLPEALRDRFQCVLEITRPHPDALAGLSPPVRRAAEASLAVDDDRRVSARGWRILDALIPLFGLETACRLVFGLERGTMIHDAILIAEGRRPRKRKPEEKPAEAGEEAR
jgi:MoxR-like ATPase